MDARSIEKALGQLDELRCDERDELGVGIAAYGLALAATQFAPTLAPPLFLGGLAVMGLGIRALWRHWELVDRLTDERDAYVIPEVLARARREATMERRETFAALLRSDLRCPDLEWDPALITELEALVHELDDRELELDPACAVACMRLVTEPEHSPLLNRSVPPQFLRSRLLQIRSGFSSRDDRSLAA